jgi:hypothetical protein
MAILIAGRRGQSLPAAAACTVARPCHYLIMAYPKNRGSGIFIEANAPLRLLQEGSYPTGAARLRGVANQSPTAGFGGIYA